MSVTSEIKKGHLDGLDILRESIKKECKDVEVTRMWIKIERG